MIHDSHHRHPIVLVLAVGSLLAYSTEDAYAQEAQQMANTPAIKLGNPLPRVTQCTGSVYNLVVYRNGGRFVVPVNKKVETTIKVPSGLTKAPMPQADTALFVVKHVGDRLFIHPKSTTDAGTETTARLVSPRFEGTLIFRTTDDASKAPDLVNVWHVSEMEAYKREVTAAAAKIADSQAQEQVMEQMLLDDSPLQGVSIQEESGRARVVINGIRWVGKHVYLPFSIRNGHDDDDALFRLTTVTAFDKRRKRNLIKDSYAERPRDRPKLPDGILADVEAGQTVRGILYIPDADKLVAPIDVVFNTTLGVPIVLSLDKWDDIDYRAKTSAEWAEIHRRERLYQQTAVSVRALGGAMWFGVGSNIADVGLEMASMTGFAAKVLKGYKNGFAVEAELAGARTSGAQFEDLTWQGSQGSVTRAATLGRLSAGGALRFGGDVMFSGRAGLSFQGASYQSEFLTNTGATMVGPGDGFEVDLGLYLGLGVDVRLGKQWMLGLAMDGGATPYNSLRFANLGLRFGYGWIP